jgi:hypothetical protein
VQLVGGWFGVEFKPAEAAEVFSSAQIGIGSVVLTCLVFVVVSLLFPDQPGRDARQRADRELEGESV